MSARAPGSAPVPVTFVSSHAGLGGAERYLELLLGQLGAGWVNQVVCLQAGPFAERLRALGYPVEIVETPRRAGMLPAAWRLRGVLRRSRPAVVHANGVKAALLAGLATPGISIPVVWVKHDFSWDGPLAALVGLRCREVVGVSRAVLATFGRRPRPRRRVVANGIPQDPVDRGRGREMALELLRCPPEAEVVTIVGRLDPVKGQAELLEAAPEVLRRRPRARFLLLGGEDPHHPSFAAGLRARVRALGLEGAVTFGGHRPDAPDLLAGSDAAVIPTIPDDRGFGREGFGLVGVEAMAVGTPVVGYADGALPEVLGDCARLVAPGDRASLGREIARVLEDDALRERLVRCGRQRARERYRLDSMASAMESVYRSAAGFARTSP